MSTFKYAGVSKLNGKIKARFANDQMRVKVLAKNGHSDIDIIELEYPMTKEDAVAFLLKINFDNGNKEVRAALEAAQEKRAEKPKAEKKAKAEDEMSFKKLLQVKEKEFQAQLEAERLEREKAFALLEREREFAKPARLRRNRPDRLRHANAEVHHAPRRDLHQRASPDDFAF